MSRKRQKEKAAYRDSFRIEMERIRMARVSFEDLSRYVTAMTEQHERGGSADAMLVLVTTFASDPWPRGRPAERRRHQWMMAMFYRMQALALLLEADALPGWTMADAEDSQLVRGELLEAAATARLTFPDDIHRPGAPTFDPAEIMALALAAREPEGAV